jgi:DMSO/TMAO reductase YedYZ molybdopterin-dependent catalytic subunit
VKKKIVTPCFMALDLATARHPQPPLATHFNGQPLTVEHGAPLRLLVLVKLGLKNVKAITRITYVAEEPQDTIGPNVDIPATTEFEEFAFLGIDGKLLPT